MDLSTKYTKTDTVNKTVDFVSLDDEIRAEELPAPEPKEPA